MGESEAVRVERDGATFLVTLANPERRNVLTLAAIEQLTSAFEEAGDSDANGVILRAQGPVFSAGHDFTEMYEADLESVRHLFSRCSAMMMTIQSIPQPVVASVQGLATGAGCQLVATCDLAVASEDSSFATPGGKGGLFCTTPLVAVGRSIGRKRALEMAMTGDPIDAATALDWGLVNRVVAPGDLDVATSDLLARATRGSRRSKAIGKLAFYEQIDLEVGSAYTVATEVMATASVTPDAQESIEAFIEKRVARWTA